MKFLEDLKDGNDEFPESPTPSVLIYRKEDLPREVKEEECKQPEVSKTPLQSGRYPKLQTKMPKRLEDYETNFTETEEDSTHCTIDYCSTAIKYHQCPEATTKQLFHQKQVSGNKKWKIRWTLWERIKHSLSFHVNNMSKNLWESGESTLWRLCPMVKKSVKQDW